MQDDATYYRSRAQQEIDAAMAAELTAVRKAHLDLAQRYQDLASALESREDAQALSSGRAPISPLV